MDGDATDWRGSRPGAEQRHDRDQRGHRERHLERLEAGVGIDGQHGVGGRGVDPGVVEGVREPPVRQERHARGQLRGGLLAHGDRHRGVLLDPGDDRGGQRGDQDRPDQRGPVGRRARRAGRRTWWIRSSIRPCCGTGSSWAGRPCSSRSSSSRPACSSPCRCSCRWCSTSARSRPGSASCRCRSRSYWPPRASPSSVRRPTVATAPSRPGDEYVAGEYRGSDDALENAGRR